MAEKTVSQRVCEAKIEIGAIPKNGYNPHGKYKHSTVDDVYHACRPVLAKHGLDLRLDIISTETMTSAKGSQWVHVKARMGFDGEELQGREMILPVTGPQTFEIVNSYLQKQYLRARFQIETGEYDEQEMTKDDPPAKPKPAPAPAPDKPKGPYIDSEQSVAMLKELEGMGRDVNKFCQHLGIPNLASLPLARYDEAKHLLDAAKAKMAEKGNG